VGELNGIESIETTPTQKINSIEGCAIIDSKGTGDEGVTGS
jgi:hypothetical protein